MNTIEIVSKKLDYRTKLECLSEEASELAKASLKVIRASRLSSNVTTISELDSVDNLVEEAIDVCMCLRLLGCMPTEEQILNSPKWKRWSDRLNAESNDRKIYCN